MTDTIYLIDGSAYIFRAYYAIAPLTTSQGFPTNALFGFSRMLIKFLADADSEQVVMVFDSGSKTFRNDLYPEYKANRGECPEDLKEQMPYFRDVSAALGLKPIELPGYEADDVIGTLSSRLSSLGKEVVIVTGDKDLMQLVNDHVSIWDTMKDRRYDSDGVVEKMGVPPEKVTEFLGITGDTSDNIPGLKGAGPKTALQLIEKYGNIEEIIKSVEEIREDKTIRNRKKISEQIELGEAILRLSRKLVEIDQNAPVIMQSENGEIPLTDMSDADLLSVMHRQAPDGAHLQVLADKFEFSDLFSTVQPPKETEVSASPYSYRMVLAKDFKEWLDLFLRQKVFAFDLETTSLDVLQADVVGISVCWSDEKAYYIPVGHQQVVKADQQISFEEFAEATSAVFSNPKIQKFGQNIKYDIGVLGVHGIKVEGIAFDTMIAAYLLNPDRRRKNLGALADEYLGLKSSEYKDVAGSEPDFSYVEIDKAREYACQDAHYAWLLTEKLKLLIESEGLSKVFQDLEMPLVPVLSAMELRGVRIETDFLNLMSKELGGKLEELQAKLYKLAGCQFNLNSPKQLSEVLFSKLEIPTKGLKKTKTGISTDSSVLEKLSVNYELPREILKYRGVFKLKSTYVDALPAQVSPRTGRLHSRFNQAVTGTGRLSSSDPNLQNIPIQSKEGRRVREAFIADSGNILISADYSQVELRVLAHVSEDKNLIAAFENDLDIHEATARELLNCPEEEKLSPEDRRIGKTLNFGIVYGMSGFRLGRELGIPVGVANNYIESYFNRYPGVKKYFAGLQEDADTLGYVTTLFGRKRILSSIDASGRDRGFLARAMINAPIQGSAADIVKLAMVKLDSRIRKENLPLEMILQIHDELVFECRKDFREEAIQIVREEMEGVTELMVPLKVDIGSGATWQEAH